MWTTCHSCLLELVRLRVWSDHNSHRPTLGEFKANSGRTRKGYKPKNSFLRHTIFCSRNLPRCQRLPLRRASHPRRDPLRPWSVVAPWTRPPMRHSRSCLATHQRSLLLLSSALAPQMRLLKLPPSTLRRPRRVTANFQRSLVSPSLISLLHSFRTWSL